MQKIKEEISIPINADRLQKYEEFLHAFEKAVESGKKRFIHRLVKEYHVSASALTVMTDIGMISGNSKNGYKLHYKTPAEPILARRVLVALYHYNRLTTEEREVRFSRPGSSARPAESQRGKLTELMNSLSDFDLEKSIKINNNPSAVRPKSNSRVKTVDEVIAEIPKTAAEQYVDTVPSAEPIETKRGPYKKRKSTKKEPVNLEIRMFGLQWYRKFKTEDILKIYILWIPVYIKKT